MMSDLIHATAQRITDLRGHFIRHARFEPLQARFRLLVESASPTLRRGGVPMLMVSRFRAPLALARAARWLSSLLQRTLIWRDHRCRMQQSSACACRLPATLKFVGQMILRALGYNLSAERQAWYIWDLVRHQLRQRQLLFLHLDEAQDLSSRGTRIELNSVASMLKTLMTDEHWPVGILLSGTEELEQILNHDPQLARRMDAMHFAPLSPVLHAPDALGLIDGYASRANLGVDLELTEIPLAERLIHAAAFQFGLVIEIIIAAIEVALLEEAQTLQVRHFSLAYEHRTSCSDAFNPFIVSDYHRIDARKVFVREAP